MEAEVSDDGPSDEVRAALAQLAAQEAEMAALREALLAGGRSGSAAPFDFEAFAARKRVGGT